MKEFLIDIIIVLGVPFAIIILMIKSDEYRDKQPCEYFKNDSMTNLPARCIEYYNK